MDRNSNEDNDLGISIHYCGIFIAGAEAEAEAGAGAGSDVDQPICRVEQ